MKLLVFLITTFPVLAEEPADKVNAVAAQIPTELPVWALVAAGLLAEAVMRLWPTAKPKSFLLMGAKLLKSVSDLLEKASGLVDKVAQNVKEK